MSTQGWIFLAVVGFLITLYIYRRSAARPQQDNQAPAATDVHLKLSEGDGPIPDTQKSVEADAEPASEEAPALENAPASEDTTTNPPSEPAPPETNGGPSDSR